MVVKWIRCGPKTLISDYSNIPMRMNKLADGRYFLVIGLETGKYFDSHKEAMIFAENCVKDIG